MAYPATVTLIAILDIDAWATELHHDGLYLLPSTCPNINERIEIWKSISSIWDDGAVTCGTDIRSSIINGGRRWWISVNGSSAIEKTAVTAIRDTFCHTVPVTFTFYFQIRSLAFSRCGLITIRMPDIRYIPLRLRRLAPISAILHAIIQSPELSVILATPAL